MANTSSLDARIEELRQEFERNRARLIEESLSPLREDLRNVEHQIAELTARANALRGELARATGRSAGKVRGERKTRAKRSPLSLEQKRERVAQILREERVGNGFPFRAVADRFAAEANISPAEMSPVNFQKFLPQGVRIEGSLRKKTFALG